MEYGTQAALGYASMVIALSFVYFGIKNYRDAHNDGVVTFGKALLVGIAISAITGIGMALIDYIYTTTINPDFMQEYAETMQEQTGEEIPMYSNAVLALVMFMTVFVIGFIISLLSSLILQRKN